MANPPSFPWVYPYTEERRAEGTEFLRQPLLRPLVVVRFEAVRLGSHNLIALVDSGADHILVAPWVAQDIGADPDPNRSIRARIGGGVRTVRFADVKVLLAPPEAQIDAGGFSVQRAHAWEAQVGFFVEWVSPPWSVVLGQVGFFDRFTVTMNRHAQALAVSDREDFDGRFSQPSRTDDSRQPRWPN